MSEKSAFFNAQLDADTGEYDRTYLAEDFAAYFSRFISNGVFPNPSTGLQVVAAAVPNMTVTMNIGYAYINGYTYENTESYTFNIDVADGVLSRRDAIFIRYDLANREIKAYKAKGTPSSAPVAPTPLRTEDYWDLCVAIIHVDGGITKIDQSLIEDTRMNTNLCGIVHGVVDHIDTTTLYKQIQQDLLNFQTVSEAEFDTWFATIKDKLSGDTAANLQSQITDLNSDLSSAKTNISKNETDITNLTARLNLLDPNDKRTDVFAAMTHRYYATFSVSSWSYSSYYGYYSQTKTLYSDTGGPAVTSSSKIMSPAMCKSSGVEDTDATLRENLSIINNGNGTLGSNNITMHVYDKPSSDITVYWEIKKHI